MLNMLNGYTWIFWLGALVTVVAMVLSLPLSPLRDTDGDAQPA